MACLHGGAAMANGSGEIDKLKLSDMERQAITDARYQLAVVLQKHSILDLFKDFEAATIDEIIEACWRGCRQSMQMQSAKGQVPFA